jgi:hypothetical protein
VRVVGHQAPPPNQDAVRQALLAEKIHVNLVIVIAKKGLLAAIPALGHGSRGEENQGQ